MNTGTINNTGDGTIGVCNTETKYTKDDFLKAAQKGEVSMIDAKHVVSLLDEVVKPDEANTFSNRPIPEVISNINQSAIDYLINEIKHDQNVKAKNLKEWNKVFKKAKKMDEIKISDEEIEEAAKQHTFDVFEKEFLNWETYDSYNDFITGAKWYREQLKKNNV